MIEEDIHVVEMTFVNAFLIRVKTGFILIDSGMPLFWGKLESELTAAGCTPDNLQIVNLIHGDIDHLGNCAKLRKQYKCKIAMHPADSMM
jgi:glyoxylase-like metal-dependent hydrolase (beta-lactamase superfamily II)